MTPTCDAFGLFPSVLRAWEFPLTFPYATLVNASICGQGRGKFFGFAPKYRQEVGRNADQMPSLRDGKFGRSIVL
jgi:hypothetical protein